MNVEKESRLQDHRRNLTLLGIAGFPFYIALGLGSAAYFRGIAAMPFLSDPAVAYKIFVIGAIGALIDVGLTIRQILRIKALESELT